MSSASTLIASQTAASNVSFIEYTSIPSSYTDLYLVAAVRTDRAAEVDSVYVRFNGQTSDSNLTTWMLYGNGSSVTSSTYGTSIPIYATSATSPSNTLSSSSLHIPQYSNTAYTRTFFGWSATERNNSTAYMNITGNRWAVNTAINALRLTPVYGTVFVAGSKTWLYGITKA